MMCSDRSDQLNALLDGMLTQAESVQVFSHLAGCDECSAYIAVMLKFRTAAARTTSTVPSFVDEAILSRVGGQTDLGMRKLHMSGTREGRSIHRYSASLPVVFAGIAACLLIGLLAGLFWNPGTRPAPESQTAMDPFRNPTAVIVVYGIPPVDVIEHQQQNSKVSEKPVQY